MNVKTNFNVIEKYENNDTKTISQYISKIIDNLIIKEFSKSIE